MVETKHAMLGPIKLAPGITAKQVVSFILFALCSACVVGFIPLMMPIIMTDQLQIPPDIHGRVAGVIQVIQQTASLVLISIFGALADRYGRKVFILIAGVGFTLSALWYPFISSLPVLIAAAFFLGVSQTAQTAGGATSVVDYPANESRGKYIALMLLTQTAASALLVGKVAMQLPSWLKEGGLGSAPANQYAFWIIAVLGLVGLTAAKFGITHDHKTASINTSGGTKTEIQAVFKNIGLLLAHARTNARLRFVLFMACVVRSDFLIVFSFLSLWIVKLGALQSIDTSTALKAAGTLFAIISVGSGISPLIAGVVADRISRPTLLKVALGMAGLAYGSTMFVDDILGPGAWLVAALIGVSEGVIIVGAQSMLGEEAPPELRGSAIGVFTMIGLAGVLVITLVGGWVFDKIGPSAPFVLVAVLNIIALGVAMIAFRTRMTASPVSKG